MAALSSLDQKAIAASVGRHDFLRRARPETRRQRGHREWFHFVVAADALELFVNLSVFDDTRPAATTPERARVLAFARVGDVWHGGVDEIGSHELQISGGQVTAQFGCVHLDHNGGSILLRGSARECPISFDLELVPLAFPSLAGDVRVGAGSAINWFVVPQLQARGTITVDRVEQRVDGAPAYHDHNWGVFGHRDFRWQWGHAGSTGRAAVLARLLDGVAGRAYLQTLFVWDGPRISRIFRGDELSLTPSGFLRRRSLTLPRLASLLAAGASEVPASVRLEARSGDDYLHGELVFEDAACLVLDDGCELDTTLLYEVVGNARLDGVVAGRSFELESRVVFETMRKA